MTLSAETVTGFEEAGVAELLLHEKYARPNTNLTASRINGTQHSAAH